MAHSLGDVRSSLEIRPGAARLDPSRLLPDILARVEPGRPQRAPVVTLNLPDGRILPVVTAVAMRLTVRWQSGAHVQGPGAGPLAQLPGDSDDMISVLGAQGHIL